MKKLLKTLASSGVIMLAGIIMPALVLAEGLSPILDANNLYQIGNKDVSSAWSKTTTAKPGQTIKFLVHVHNNVVDSTANNVKVQATLPTGEVSSFTSTATVSADNATAVSSTTSFTLSENAKVEYIPGSTVAFDHNNNSLGTLPDTIWTTGVNVGNIKGCWEFEKWIKFEVKVVEKPVTLNPMCTLTANPTSIGKGGKTTLKWTTSNATKAMIDQGIGSVAPVSAGSIQAIVNQNTKYTLTATGENGKTVTCSAEVVVKEEQVTPAAVTETPQATLPVTGPAEAVMGTIGGIALAGSTLKYRKSKSILNKAFRFKK